MRTERVLVSMKKYIGDAVMAAPMVDAIEREYTGLHFVCGPAVAQVLQSEAKERHFISLDTSRKLGDVLRSARSLRGLRFDRAVIVNHSFRSALTIRLAGIPVRIGHIAEGRRILLTNAIPYSETEFEAWSCLSLAAPLGVPMVQELPRLSVTDAERDEGRRVLSGATIGIQPGATFEQKSLPVALLVTVCNRLLAEGCQLALLGAKEEAARAAQLEQELQTPVVNLVGKTSLRTSMGALANLRLTVGADTGMMHTAAAVGCPTITVFGPTPLIKWGHQYPPHQALQARDGVMANLEADELLAAIRASGAVDGPLPAI